MVIGTFKSSINANSFKSYNPVEGAFKFRNSLEGVHLREKVEKFVAHNPISNASWDAYCTLRSIRTLGRSIFTPELGSFAVRTPVDSKVAKELASFDVLWDEYTKSEDFGIALTVEKLVLKVDPWC